MLIIPVENKPDWRHPPVVTLLLILINSWVYFSLLDGDESAYADARQAYLAGGLLEHEAPLFREYHAGEGPLPRERGALVDYILLDTGFDAYVAPHLVDDAQWRRARERFERSRDELSWISMGLNPADTVWWTYLTSMFLHGGVDHLLGNMVFLFLFGFALERVLGSVSFSAVYLLGGLAGGLVHVAVNAGSSVPTIGASGAVSALMGAYLAVYRLRRIHFFYSVLVYFGELRAPALLMLPLWVGKELFGYLFGDQGIAYWDHIGGLVAGAALGEVAMRFSPAVDSDYLDSGRRQTASRAVTEELDALVDEFKYDQARKVAAVHLADHPGDATTWERYLGLLAADAEDSEHRAAVTRLLNLAGSPAGASPEMARVIASAYRACTAGKHPRSILNDPILLCRLAELFARSGAVDDARRIANMLLKADRRDPELATVLDVLCRTLAAAGSGALADHYRKELRVRFPHPPSPGLSESA